MSAIYVLVLVGFKLSVIFVGDVGRYGCIMELWLYIEGFEWMLQNENMYLLSYADSCGGWGDVVPVPWETPIMVTDNLCVAWCE